MEAPFLSIIIPAYNEERRIGGTLQQIVSYVLRQPFTAEVLVVDDGSADGTAAAVRAFEGDKTPVRLLTAPHRGKGHAVRAGMLAARGRYRFQCDADLAMPIDQVARFLPPALSDVDVAVGSREAAGARRYNEPWHRHLMGRIFNAIVRAMTVRGIRDTQCGFKCFRAEAAERLFRQQRIDGFAADVEVLFLARRAGLRIAEVAIDWHHSRDSRVRPFRDTLAMLGETMQIRWNQVRGQYRL